MASPRAEQLRATTLFADLADEHLERLAAHTQTLRLDPGEFLIREGDPAEDLYAVVVGELDITKRSGNADVYLNRVGPGSIQGEIAGLERGARMASVRAVSQVEVLRIPYEALGDLLAAGPAAVLALVRTITGRLRGMEEALRQREKLAGLGTLAAGLAHELNNPAAAIRRSAASLVEVTRERNAAAAGITAGHPQLAALTRAAPSEAGRPLDALTRSDRTDEIAGTLRDAGLSEAGNPDEAAGRLAAAGWTPDDVRQALAGFDATSVEAAVRWLSSVATADELLAEVQMAAERISSIVGAVKGYAYLDQAPIQRFNVCRGIDDTLLILAHKLRDVKVTRDYAPDLPEIEGWGSELNQVWTNILDNAADAMEGTGDLSIRVEKTDAGGVCVTICDSGQGIPPETRDKIFEPFFTTKPPGVGSGLGLHLSHNIVVKHGGTLDVESAPGRTCFEVVLPPTLPAAPVEAGAR
ncbi:MAG: sensor histidine kinase [Candidatus Limnocylindria bacterium]